jgi:hypothetical protein
MNPDPVLTGSGLLSEVGSGSGPNRSGSATLVIKQAFMAIKKIQNFMLISDLKELFRKKYENRYIRKTVFLKKIRRSPQNKWFLGSNFLLVHFFLDNFFISEISIKL